MIQFGTAFLAFFRSQFPSFDVLKFHSQSIKEEKNGARKSNGKTGNFSRCSKI